MASQAGLKEVVSLYQTLIKEWNRKPVDLEKVGKLLSGMKVSEFFVRLFPNSSGIMAHGMTAFRNLKA